MASSTIPGVYASALIELARERGTIDAVIASCRKLAEAMAPEALRQLDNPRITRQDAKRVLGATVAQEPKEITDLLQLLVDRNRLDQAAAIMHEVVRLYEEQQGIVHVHVTIAADFTEAFKQRVIERIRSRNGAGAILDLSIDPALIGGFTSRIGDQYVDASGRRVLAEMRRAMLATPLADSLWSA